MKKLITFLSFVLLAGIFAKHGLAQEGMVTLKSNYSVEKTLDRLENVLTENRLTIFRKVDHREGATTVDMKLPPTTVIIFGNPKLGTPLMKCAPTVAIDLPQKMLVWQSKNGSVYVGYNAPEYLKKRHGIEGCDQVLQKINGALKKFAQTAAGIK